MNSIENEINKPLVSFVLITYNHELFIKDAIEAALSQDYDNTELVVSDDCSKDSTFAIISDCLKKYSGPKKIVFNRNENNLGLASNFNKAVGLANGEFIVIASGDDVSHPDRIRKLVLNWMGTGFKKYVLFHSKLRIIDKVGNIISSDYASKYSSSLKEPLDIVRNGEYAMGSTIAWPKSLFDFYGPIKPGILNEDSVMAFRASLKDGIIHVEECLIDYRVAIGSAGSPMKNDLSKEEKFYKKRTSAGYYKNMVEQYIKDFEKSEYESKMIRRILRKRINQAESLCNAYCKSFSYNFIRLGHYYIGGVSVRIVLFIFLLSFFKEFGYSAIPHRLLK